ncbi:hypothetical protein [Pedobacter panaciterrae]|uniref:hypothetical protein n=1 Tax=Pedobacter panaciterrae TaxID=363849 RepID=UPI002592E279|nr:hypothetical protein [uncultured Pedobacter sp.]
MINQASLINYISSREKAFFRSNDFFTGKLGLATALIQFGAINNDDDQYADGAQLLRKILHQESQIPKSSESEILILCVVIKFLNDHGFLDVDVDVIDKLSQEILSKYLKDPLSTIDNFHFILILNLKGVEKKDEVLFNEIIIRLSNLRPAPKDHLFIYFCQQLAEYVENSFPIYSELIKERINDLYPSIPEYASNTDWGIAEILSIYEIYKKEKELKILKRFCDIDGAMAKSLKISFAFAQLKDNHTLPYQLKELEQIINESQDLGLVNGMLSQIYLDAGFYKKANFESIAFVLKFYLI